MSIDIRNIPIEELCAKQWQFPGRFPKIALLMITHNRLAYTKKSLHHLLTYTDVTSPPFDLYIVDNASNPETVEFLKSIKDPRIVERTFNTENRTLSSVTNDFWLKCLDKGYHLVGKVDNDTLVPRGWLGKMVSTHMASNQFGALGCFSFDYYTDFKFQTARRSIRKFGTKSILVQPYIGGCAYTLKTWVIQRVGYLQDNIILKHHGKAVKGVIYGWDWWEAQAGGLGFVHGYLYPLMCCEHMDDPLSPNCLLDKDPEVTALAKRNAEQRGLTYSRENISRWIRDNAVKLFVDYQAPPNIGKRVY